MRTEQIPAAEPIRPAPYVTEQQLAKLIGIPLGTLQTRRYREPEKAPPYRRLGRRIIYKWDEVVAWLDEQTLVEDR